MKKLFRNVAIIALSIVAISCSKDENKPAQQTITQIAVANPNLSTLVEALQRTGLDEQSSTEQFTVFAPTNTAFQNYLTDNGYTSLDDLTNAELTQLLLNHIITGALQSTQLTTGYIETNATFGGTETDNFINMYVSTASGVRLNGVSSVETPNIIASNGVIHVVNAVIPIPTVVDHVVANPEFDTLQTAVTSPAQSGVLDALSGLTAAAPATLFAPNNAAFATALGAGGFADDASDAAVSVVLKYHVTTAGNVRSSQLTNNQSVPMFTNPVQNTTVILGGGNVDIRDTANNLSRVFQADIQCSNGVIHGVTKVLQPQL